jgi:hypothetical protein
MKSSDQEGDGSRDGESSGCTGRGDGVRSIVLGVQSVCYTVGE